MAKRSGIAAQLGFRRRGSWGPASPSTGSYPSRRRASPRTRLALDSDSIYAGRLVRHRAMGRGRDRRRGDIELDVYTKGMGLLLKRDGAVNTTGSGPYVHAFTPDVLDGLGLTLQVGKPDRGGTVRPWNFVGSKIREFELMVPAKEAAALKPGISSKTID